MNQRDAPMNQHDAIQHAVKLLRQGKLVAIPTETVYGLAADAKNESAISKVFAVKGRPETNPLIIHLSDLAAISDWARDIPGEAYQLAESFWPGPLTLILERQPWVSPLITAHQNTVGIRIPNHPVTLELLREFGGGLAAPSANRYRRISPTQKTHVEKELGNEVDYILDGGPSTVGIESTIVYCGQPNILILRQGAITAAQIESLLGKKVILNTEHQSFENLNAENQHSQNQIRTPGQDEEHYAPQKPLYCFESHEFYSVIKKLNQEMKKNQMISVVSFQEKPREFLDQQGIWIKGSENPQEFAKQWYAILHELDKNETDMIVIEMPPRTEAWSALLDRIRRASRTMA